jgi:hypothetical protein
VFPETLYLLIDSSTHGSAFARRVEFVPTLVSHHHPDMAPELRLSVAADFSREWDAGKLMGIGVTADHRIVGVIATASYSIRRRWRIAAEAVIVGPSTRRVPLDPLEFRSGVLPQATRDGALVIIGGRRVIDEPNAVVLDRDGHQVSSFSVGDGVESALLDDEDQLWVSYFDEGTTGGDPLSSTGLNRFALNGLTTWSYEATYALEPIVDCYALNVIGTSAWAYVYP